MELWAAGAWRGCWLGTEASQKSSSWCNVVVCLLTRAGQHIFISTNDTDWSSSAATSVLMDHSNISDPASRHESYKVCSNKSYQDGAAHHH